MGDDEYRYWWQRSGDDLAKEVEAISKTLEDEQGSRRERYIRNLELFEGYSLGGYGAHAYYQMGGKGLQTDRLGLVRSAVQTGVAEVYGRLKPIPQVQTSGADWPTKRRAKRMAKVFEGVLHQRQGRWLNVWRFMVERAGTECLVQGCAAIKVLADLDEQRIVHELKPVCELYVDPCEGAEPQNLVEVSPIDEAKAISLFASGSDERENEERREAICGAEPWDYRLADRRDTSRQRITRQVAMRTMWRLPISEDEPGKVAVVIGGKLMAEDNWEAPMFPFVFLRWEPHLDGMWGMGIADIGRFLAEEAGELDRRLLARAKIAAGRRVYFTEGSVDPEHLEKNGPEVHVPVQAGAPHPTETLVPPFTPGEFEYRDAKIRDYWDAVGLSQTRATARREPGVDTGVAMRLMNETKDGRQLVQAQRFEHAFVDLAHQYVWRLRELEKAHPGVTVTWPGKRLFAEIRWSEADITKDTFTITAPPASALPRDPWGRQEMVGMLYRERLITPQTYRQLLDWPDLEQEMDVESAEFEYLDALIDRYLDAEEGTWDAGDYEAPEGFLLDKPRALMRFASAYFRARLDKAPEFNLGLLRRYIQELEELIREAVEAQMAMQQQAGPPPGAPGLPGGEAVEEQMAMQQQAGAPG